MSKIVETVRNYVKLSGIGDTLRGLCPFHSEKTPSFIVDSKKQRFYCFGCGETGTAEDFSRMIQAKEKL